MANPASVQTVGAAATANVSSLGVAITPTSGNNLIAAVVVRNGATGATGPAGWTKAIEVIASNFATSIWYLENYSGSGAQTYTWTMAASDSMEVIIQEVSGLATSGSLDKTASNNSGGVATNPVDSGTTATTSSATEFWAAAMGSSGSGNRTISGLTSGWTQDTTENSSVATHPTHLTDCYQVASATGAADCQFTLSTAQIWNACVATFTAASGALDVSGGLAGSGALTGEPVALVAGALQGAGALTGSPVALLTGGLAGQGALAGEPVALVSGGLAGQGALSGTLVGPLASGALAGSGAVAGQPVALLGGSLAGAGQLAGQSTALVSGGLAGAGALTGASVALVFGALGGTGALSGTAQVITPVASAPGSVRTSDTAFGLVAPNDAGYGRILAGDSGYGRVVASDKTG